MAGRQVDARGISEEGKQFYCMSEVDAVILAGEKNQGKDLILFKWPHNLPLKWSKPLTK